MTAQKKVKRPVKQTSAVERHANSGGLYKKIDDIIEAIENGDIKKPLTKKGKRSPKYVGEKCTITINPDDGTLIQCNPNDNMEKY